MRAYEHHASDWQRWAPQKLSEKAALQSSLLNGSQLHAHHRMHTYIHIEGYCFCLPTLWKEILGKQPGNKSKIISIAIVIIDDILSENRFPFYHKPFKNR